MPKIKTITTWVGWEEKYIYWGWSPWSNTIAYYPLNSTTTVNDRSGNGYNWTLNWTITFGSWLWWVDCAYFSWNSWSYIQVAHNTKLATNTVTYSMWIASKDYNWNRWIIYKWAFNGGNWIYSLSNYTNINWRIWDTSHSYTAFSWNDVWTYLTVTYDWTSWNVYKNWTLLWSFNQSATISWDTNPLYIWAYRSSSYCFYWYISNLIVEDKVRTADEIAKYYDQTKKRYWY